MTTKPWGGAGSWAADSELPEEHPQDPLSFSHDSSFPTLGEAVATKTSKKKKGQTLSLSEFNTGVYVGPGAKSRAAASADSGLFSEYKGLTPGEMMMLPTGPRDRSGEDPAPFGGLGGGFKDYGGYRGGRDNGEGRDRDGGRYGSGDREGGFNRGGGFGGDRDRSDEPSRADTNDDWGATKKFVPSSGGHYDDDRRRGGRMSDRDFPSKADDDSHWGSSKKFVPPVNGGEPRRGMGRFDDIPSRGGGFHDRQGPSKADDADNWASSKKTVSGGGFDSLQRDRDFGAPRDRDFGAPRDRDVDSWTRKDTRILSTDRPRLNLQPRSRPVDSSTPVVSSGDEEPVKAEDLVPKPQKVNPFGGARPREVILEAKGMDWKKLDAGLERKPVDRVDSDEELSLKNEIKTLQEAINSKMSKEAPGEGEEEEEDLSAALQDLKEQLSLKEQELATLSVARADKLRLAKERPSSGSGSREGGNAWSKERPSSGSGSREGTNVWTRSSSNGEGVGNSNGNTTSNGVSVPERRGRW